MLGMKMWLSAAEIAALELPGLPTVTRAAHRVAVNGGWPSQPRAGRGGGVEYHIDALPPVARAAYVARHVGAIEVPASIAREAAAAPGAEQLAAPAAEVRDARLAILALADKLKRDARISRAVADRQICDGYNTGALDVAPWIRTEVKSITPRTLKRWRRRKAKAGASGLAVDRAAARRGTGVLDRANGGDVRIYILALLAKQPQLTAQHVRALTADRFGASVTIGDAAIALPPLRTFQHALKAWRGNYRNELEYVRNPDRFKSAIRFAAVVARPASVLNEVWQIDASPADAFCLDGRHAIYVGVDVYSRRLVGLVTRTARADAVALLLRKAILAWGVPARVKTDNGSDFIARATQRLFAALAIEHETAAPFSPEQKGHVERAIGTLQRGLMRTLPGFAGHSVADAQVIRARKTFAARLGEDRGDAFQVALSAAELQQRVDDWCEHVYATAPHAGLDGRTPFEVAATAPSAVRRIEDARALDLLLAPVAGKDGLRTVTKTGIRVGKAHYIAGFLDVGSTVLVRMDPSDMGRAYVYAEDGVRFLGTAVAPELAGVDPAHAIAAARAEQKRLRDQKLAEVRKIKIDPADMAPAILRQAMLAAPNVSAFPRRADTHDTPQLAAAREALAEPTPVHSAEVLAMAERLRREAEAPADNVKTLRDDETPHQRWNRACALEAQLARDEIVDTDELIWLGGYREGPEYRGFAKTYRDDAAPSTQAGRQAQ